MIGYLAIPAHVAKVLLVVAPFMTDEPRVPLDKLLADGFQVQSAVRDDGIVLFLQKGPELYGCQVSTTMLASGFQPAGEIASHDILCTPFR
ncbi:hypothetical protein ACMDCR_21130 [Labrys okinawensis]|uniref:hypothetical protein n=1 Tax=Labrys okinawensis TaxID=346911 RepID=UPI0039BC2F1F